MNTSNFYRSTALVYGMPLLVLISSVIIAISPLLQKYPYIAIGITYDLTLIAPLLFLFLSRKSTTSKLQAIPFFIGGILIATCLLPENQQEHLEYVKKYLFPVIELLVLATVVFKIYSGLKVFKSNSVVETDFYEISAKSAEELFGKSKFTALFTSEITMLYYAFFAWRKSKSNHYTFTNYKENAGIALAGAFLMVIFIETFAFHVLVMKWSTTAAWILTATSIYTAFMILAHIKALILNPSLITKEQLILKNGLIARTKIELKNISNVEFCTTEKISTDKLKVGNLGLHKESTNHNIAIYFKEQQIIQKAYGIEQTCDMLFLHIDDKNSFLNNLNLALEQYKDINPTK